MNFFDSEPLVVIFEFYAKNVAEWWPRELGSRSVNLFPSTHLLVKAWQPVGAHRED